MNRRPPTDALARARRLLYDGFVISAANVLVNDARDVAKVATEPAPVQDQAVADVKAGNGKAAKRAAEPAQPPDAPKKRGRKT